MSFSNAMHKTNEDRNISRAIIEDHPSVLADIYQEEINIAIWRRALNNDLIQAADQIIKAKPTLQKSLMVTPQNTKIALQNVMGNHPGALTLAEDIAKLVDMFCCLFELKGTGLRLAVLNNAMCPRFHADRVPCRLVTTYQGIATQWLPHNLADRSKLDVASKETSDETSGLFAKSSDIQNLNKGDVALLKGELWAGNENAGLIHRSPQLESGANRLLLTLDFIND